MNALSSLPRELQTLLDSLPCQEDGVGHSGSRVLLFPQLVLKIEPLSPETENQRAVLVWGQGKLPLPRLEWYQAQEGLAYTLLSRIDGRMLCDEELMLQPAKLASLLAETLHLLWRTDTAGCPDGVSPLSRRLERARRLVEQGLVSTDDAEPETYGKGSFANPEALLRWLEQNRPPEDVVFTHGDLSLPNIFARQGRICGLIDLGKAGPADRWQDIAIADRSLHHNFAGHYGRAYPGYSPSLLFDALGIPPDREKLRYYTLLDELF